MSKSTMRKGTSPAVQKHIDRLQCEADEMATAIIFVIGWLEGITPLQEELRLKLIRSLGARAPRHLK